MVEHVGRAIAIDIGGFGFFFVEEVNEAEAQLQVVAVVDEGFAEFALQVDKSVGGKAKIEAYAERKLHVAIFKFFQKIPAATECVRDDLGIATHIFNVKNKVAAERHGVARGVG